MIWDYVANRNLIFSTRIRFSPQSQEIRNSAIDSIVEKQLYLLDNKDGVDLSAISNSEQLCVLNGTPIINSIVIEDSLKRLITFDKVICNEMAGTLKYRLSDKAIKEHELSHKSAETRYLSVLNKLLSHEADLIRHYQEPFMDCLCNIFSKLADTYVRLIKGEFDGNAFLKSPFIAEICDEVASKYNKVDKRTFHTMVFMFFQHADPDYDHIKWNLAQNYYISKAIGLDPSGFLLSKELFGNADLYLDTNVLIQALEPKARHHCSFNAMSKACRNLNINLKVAQISLDELTRVINYRKNVMKKVIDRIPEETAPKIGGIFYRLYRDALLSGESIDLDDLYSSFLDPMEFLSSNYTVSLEDDPWFDEQKDTQEISELIDSIQQQYKMRKKLRLKTPSAAMHDALLLKWINRQRKLENEKTWIITNDKSLPNVLYRTENGEKSFAITLDALLQWMSPIAIYGEAEESEVAAMFSEAVKFQLLPQENLFDIKDFLMFSEMEIETKQLPSEDVEGCIKYIRMKAHNLDPNIPSDREKLTREVSRYFADPGRKYKENIANLEAEVESNMNEKLSLEKEIEKRDTKIDDLTKRICDMELEHKKYEITRSAKNRFIACLIMFFIIEITISMLSIRYLDGNNVYQKLINGWQFNLYGALLSIGLSWVIIGKERILSLGWPFNKLAN